MGCHDAGKIPSIWKCIIDLHTTHSQAYAYVGLKPKNSLRRTAFIQCSLNIAYIQSEKDKFFIAKLRSETRIKRDAVTAEDPGFSTVTGKS